MPIYEYQCDRCGKRFEEIQKFSDPPLQICPMCGGAAVHRLLSSPAIQFKGSGWYITDYARKERADGEGGGGKTDATTTKGKVETKTASESKNSSSDASSSSAGSSADASPVKPKKD